MDTTVVGKKRWIAREGEEERKRININYISCDDASLNIFKLVLTVLY